MNLPKFTFEITSQMSPPEALRSCRVKSARLQSGMKLLFESVQLRNAALTDELKGWKRRVRSLRLSWLYRPSEALTAVRPLPNTSYEMPSRGLMSLHVGTPLSSSTWRAG